MPSAKNSRHLLALPIEIHLVTKARPQEMRQRTPGRLAQKSQANLFGKTVATSPGAEQLSALEIFPEKSAPPLLQRTAAKIRW